MGSYRLQEIAIHKILPGVEAAALVDIALARRFSQDGQTLTAVVIVTVLNVPDRRVAVTALAARRAPRTCSVLLVHLASLDKVCENCSDYSSSRYNTKKKQL
ncbi:hypothetical protein TUN199_11402 [Pyrenophora tritici-repentis]|nr:hypothetical protein Alg130_11460 [Pyrenophora tritici-repentis]KAI0604377.1 hypothetical protein TUN205_11376 [Pyrenophora tritici-repentis]KAI0616606.1 hypothetical protein TUN199_11402 [Pyrenophora tritici-repentis]